MDKISVIVPCYNEEEMLPLFYEEITKVAAKMQDVDFEFIFVNDGSKDNTLKLMRGLAKKDERVKYISFSRNFKKEAAIYAGLEKATGDYVTLMDVDLQDPPELLEKMYKILKEEEYDCVALKTNSHEGYGFIRKFFTNCYYKVISRISSVEMVPGARDFRLMTRQMTDAVLELKEYNRYSKGLFSFVGFDTKWLSYDAPDRKAGTSKWSFWKLFAYAMEAIVAFSTTPLVISTVVGILLCLIAFIMIIVIIAKTLIWGDPVGGWPSLACIVIFIGGIQLLFLGIIGQYLAKTYLETKKRPIYIVKETEEKVRKGSSKK